MEELLAANRANWDDRTSIHLESRFYDVEGWLREERGPRAHEVDALGDVTGLRLLHLQCHFGLDTLAWARAGAQVTGLDFSPVAIEAALRLARRAGLAERSTFVCADVFDAVHALDRATFDVVYVSTGALCWLPSVDRWAAQVGALVAPDGRLYLHDGHPVSWALAEDRLCFEHTYFEEVEPFVDDSDVTYTDADRPIRSRRSYEWNHGMGEIVTALVGHGLRIEWLAEHDWADWQRFPWLVRGADGWWSAAGATRVPLSFTLLARRPR
jgi:SAM-dependent methyltransferase